MVDSSLGQVLLFCGTVFVPLSFCILFTYSQFEKYQETRTRQYILGMGSGAGIVVGCMLYISSVVLQYFQYMSLSELSTVIATGAVLVGATGVGLSKLLSENGV